MSTATANDSARGIVPSVDDHDLFLATTAGDARHFLRRLLEGSVVAESIVCVLLEDPGDEQWWLACANSADAEVRAFLVEHGFPGASAARAVEVGEERATLAASTILHVVHGTEGRRAAIVHRSDCPAAAEILSWGLSLLEAEVESQRLHDELTATRQRLDQVRTTLRAGLRSARAFADLESAAEWVRDLRRRLDVEAVALFVDDHGDAVALTEIATTEELADAFLATSVSQTDLPASLRVWDLLTDRWSPRTLDASRSGDGDTWPSLACIPATGPRGERMWVVLGSRLPRSFSPESVEMLRAAVGALAHDIGELLEQERRRRDELSRILHAIPLGMMLVAEDTSVSAVNPQLRELVGLHTEVADLFALSAAIGFDLSCVHESATELAPRECLEQRVSIERLGRNLSLEVRAVHAGPHRRQWLWTIRDESLEQRRERARAEFVSTVGHELKTPLTSLQTALELLSNGELGELDGEQEHFVRLGLRGCERLQRRVDQLLDISRFEHGRLGLEPREIALDAALEEVIEELRLRARREHRQFECQEIATSEAFVDPDRVGEIVENLVTNAFKFCPRSGRVSLQLRGRMPAPRESDREIASRYGISVAGAEIVVADNGEGMSPSTLQHAFDPFYQEGDPLSDRPEGVGLGLSIVRALVRAHHGDIDIESELGQGTAVRVWIPADAAAARFKGTLDALRTALEEASVRGRRLHLTLERAPDGGNFTGDLSLVWGADPPADAACSVQWPTDGRRAGTLLAELHRRWTGATSPAETDRSGKARND